MNFNEMHELVSGSYCAFSVGGLGVRICEAAGELPFMKGSEPGSVPLPRSMGRGAGVLADPDAMRVFRVTYTIPSQEVTTVLTAQGVDEARRMVWEFLRDRVTSGGHSPLTGEMKLAILRAARSAEIGEDPAGFRRGRSGYAGGRPVRAGGGFGASDVSDVA